MTRLRRDHSENARSVIDQNMNVFPYLRLLAVDEGGGGGMEAENTTWPRRRPSLREVLVRVAIVGETLKVLTINERLDALLDICERGSEPGRNHADRLGD